MTFNTYNLIAETAFSHEGSLDYLIKLTDAAKKSKSDFVKYQILINKEQSYTDDADLYNKIDQWILTKSEWITILNYAKKLNLKTLVLPLNIDSLTFCMTNDLLIDALEVHSVTFNEVPFLKILSEFKKKIFLGIGGRFPDEINFALSQLNTSLENIVLMYGFQSFPTKTNYINLSRIPYYKSLFNASIGYADHCGFNDKLGDDLASYALLLGCQYIEKHIVLEKGVKRIDYESAICYQDFISLREKLDTLISILGNGNIFELNAPEYKYRSREKSIVATTDLHPGHNISECDLTYKITKTKSPINQQDYLKLINRKTKEKIMKDSIISFDNLL